MAAVAARSPWLTVEAIALIVLGVAALALPFAAGLAAALIFGWILILSGIVGLVSAFAGGQHAHMGWGLLSALIALLVGVLLLINPIAGAVGLTILLGAYLFVDGVALIGLALDQRRRSASRWSWLLASGIFDLILAVLILLLNAAGSAFIIGVIVGIDLIAAGFALLFVHRSATTAVAI